MLVRSVGGRLTRVLMVILVVGACGDAEIAELRVTPETVEMGFGDTLRLTVTALDDAGGTAPGVTVVFNSSAPGVVSVDDGGLLEGTGAGTATITAAAGEVQATVSVTAIGPPARVVVDQDTVRLNVGASLQVSVSVFDALNQEVVNAADTVFAVIGSAATVTDDGTVSGAGAGPALLAVTVGTAADTASIEVFGRPAGTIAMSTPVGQRPFGIAVGRTGVVYTSRLDAAQLTGGTLPSTTLPDVVNVDATPTSVAFSPSGTRAYVANQGGSVSVVDAGTKMVTGSVPIGGSAFYVAVTPDGARAFVTANTDRVYLLDLAAQAVSDSVATAGAPNGIAFSPTQNRMYVSAFFGNAVYEVDASSLDVLRTIPVSNTPQGIVAAPDGSVLYVAREGGSLWVVSIASGAVSDSVPAATNGFGAAMTPDGTQLYVTSPSAGVVHIVDVGTLTVSGSIPTGGIPRRVAFDYFGEWAAISDESGAVHFVQ